MSDCCTWHMCWLYVCMVVDRHLVVCVGYMLVCAVLVFSLAALRLHVKSGAWHAPDARGEWLL